MTVRGDGIKKGLLYFGFGWDQIREWSKFPKVPSEVSVVPGVYYYKPRTLHSIVTKSLF